MRTAKLTQVALKIAKRGGRIVGRRLGGAMTPSIRYVFGADVAIDAEMYVCAAVMVPCICAEGLSLALSCGLFRSVGSICKCLLVRSLKGATQSLHEFVPYFINVSCLSYFIRSGKV